MRAATKAKNILGLNKALSEQTLAASITGCFRCQWHRKGCCSSPPSTWRETVCVRGRLDTWDGKQSPAEFLVQAAKQYQQLG